MSISTASAIPCQQFHDKTMLLSVSEEAKSYPFNLGGFHRAITCNTQEAQIWFDRGLVWTYGFNHHEAAQCFRRASKADPSCAMAYWGLAYTLGPHYNKPWNSFGKAELDTTLTEIHEAVKAAKDAVLRSFSSSLPSTITEKAIIRAIIARYPTRPLEPLHFERCNEEYADAMAEVYELYPNDLDVAALYADSMLNLSPWELWDKSTGEPRERTRTRKIQAVLERALKQDKSSRHPGILHFYIHLVEMSSTPELGFSAAELLRGLVPDAGHLEHMPSHLEILLGEYQKAVATNQKAVRSDEKFFSLAGNTSYVSYRVHNLQSLINAAMFLGNREKALQAVVQLEQALPERLLRCESMADRLEANIAMRAHVLVRFGNWVEILDLDMPVDESLYCVTTAIMRYARGIAQAVLGDVAGAEEERQYFKSAKSRVPPTRMLFPNRCLDILAVAEPMLDGEIEYRKGNIESAFSRLREAVRADDALTFNEPWGWMQPTRHALAALLLEQNQVEEAAAVYAADLGLDHVTSAPRGQRHPNNVWALHGYHECLIKLGRDEDAQAVAPRLETAVQAASIPVTASCLCRKSGKQIDIRYGDALVIPSIGRGILEKYAM